MAHFAEIDSDNKVIRVLVVPNDQEHRGQEYLANDLAMGGSWIQTSYNAKIRGKFAGIGDIYDQNQDVFITAKPHFSWIWNGEFWDAPKPRPDGIVEWNEEIGDWVDVSQTL
jgi:hypothetical protein